MSKVVRRFDTKHACDGQTDRQTKLPYSIHRAYSTASRGENGTLMYATSLTLCKPQCMA